MFAVAEHRLPKGGSGLGRATHGRCSSPQACYYRHERFGSLRRAILATRYLLADLFRRGRTLALGVAIVLSVIGAYAVYRYYSEYSHVLPVEDPDAHDVLGHDLHSTNLPQLHHEHKDAQPER